MVRPYANRRLQSQRSHVHIEKDDGNRKLKLTARPRGEAPIKNSSKASPAVASSGDQQPVDERTKKL
jgi:hypothetical protein